MKRKREKLLLPDYVSDSGRVRLYCGDSLSVLRRLTTASVHCIVTSPPYWGLRDYGNDKSLEFGSEKTPEEFVERLVILFHELRRVLRDDGSIWLNLGDSYAGGGGFCPYAPSNKAYSSLTSKRRGLRPAPIPKIGLRAGNLVGIPWRVALALQADGWILRQDIIWSKKSPMPEPVTNRCTKSHEYVFLLTKSMKYYFDAYAIREPLVGKPHIPGNIKLDASRKDRDSMDKVWGGDGHHNKRSVWTLAAESYGGAHFATFPTQLVIPCIQAGTSEKGCCSKCGAPQRRIVEKEEPVAGPKLNRAFGEKNPSNQGGLVRENGDRNASFPVSTLGWEPSCDCGKSFVPCTVCDPFSGSGTTCQVANYLRRDAIGIELSAEYLELSKARVEKSVGATFRVKSAGALSLFK